MALTQIFLFLTTLIAAGSASITGIDEENDWSVPMSDHHRDMHGDDFEQHHKDMHGAEWEEHVSSCHGTMEKGQGTDAPASLTTLAIML